MDTYRLMLLYEHTGSSWINIFCTHQQELDLMLAELRKVSPSCYLHGEGHLPSGEAYVYRIRSRDKNSVWAPVIWWMMKYLCSTGWEPFATRGAGHELFRKKTPGETTSSD